MEKRIVTAASLFLLGTFLASAEIVANLGIGLPGSASGATETTITTGSGGYSAGTDAAIVPRGACLDANLELGHSMISGRTVFGLGLDYKTLGTAMLRFDDDFALGAPDLFTAYTYLRLELSRGLNANIRGGFARGPYLGLYFDLWNLSFGADIALMDIQSGEEAAGQKYDFEAYTGYSILYRLRLDKPKGVEKPYLASRSKSAANAAILGYGLGVPLAFAGTFLYLVLAQ